MAAFTVTIKNRFKNFLSMDINYSSILINFDLCLTKVFLSISFKIFFKNLSFDLWVIIIIDDDFLFLSGFCTNRLIDTLFLEKIFVMLDKTPGLSSTSNLK